MKRLFVLVTTALVLLACEPSSDQAVDPVWSKQPCAHCGMLVGEPRYAAEITKADGTRLFFDDVGCMISYVHELPAPPRRIWVHEADGRGWIDARSASYLDASQTPMGFGLIGTAHGGGVSWDVAQQRVLARKDAPHVD